MSCPKSCPQIGDVTKSPLPSVAALVPSAGTLTNPENLIHIASAVGTRIPVALRGTCLRLTSKQWLRRSKCLNICHTRGLAAMLIASPALAKERSALESASVKAASDCVAAAQQFKYGRSEFAMFSVCHIESESE